ncbi:MAG: hypothetical protein AABX55_02155, partial [Nanoarchaeota archaeon]
DVSIKNILLPGERAEFEIEIKNFQSFKDDFKLFVTDFNWREEKNIDTYSISPGSSKKDTVKLFPRGILPAGKYSINLRIYSLNDAEVFIDHSVVVEILAYNDLLKADLEFNPQGLDPRKENLVKLNLKNKHEIKLDSLNVQIKNSLFTQEFITSLAEKESKSFDFSITLTDAKEGNYDTLIYIKMDDNILVNKNVPIKVSAYSNVRELKKEESVFLINTLEITRTNDGNTISKEIFTRLVPPLQNTFTKATPNPTKIEKVDNDYKYTWQFDLNPKQSYTILIKTNYRTPLIIFIIVVAVLIFGYNVLRTELSIKKKVLLLKSKEGNISHLKVLLTIKCGHANARNLHLVDNIPGVFEAPGDFITLKPSSVKKGLAGSTLIWEIPEILRGEERVISYKVKSHAPLVGRVRIPRAICRYKNVAGKISIAKSNSVNLFS